jgi:hypothetical protein
MRLLTGHREQVRGVAYPPDGLAVAAAGTRPDVVLWDVETP